MLTKYFNKENAKIVLGGKNLLASDLIKKSEVISEIKKDEWFKTNYQLIKRTDKEFDLKEYV